MNTLKRLLPVAGFLFAVFPGGAATLAQTNPVPLIEQPLQPDAITPGSGRFTLTVTGTGFVSGSVVNWSIGGITTPLSTTFLSSSQLSATVPSANLAVPGTSSVTVGNSGRGAVGSNAQFLQITQPTSLVSLSRTDFPTGAGLWIVQGDFNGDGKPDLVAVDFDGNNVGMQLGNGDGTFESPVFYPAGTLPTSATTADFNGDGILDVAVTDQGSSGPGSVAVLLGKGDGTLLPPIQTTVGNGPGWLAAGDFNQDGKEDLAAVNQLDDTVSILLGNGDGTFQTPVNYSPLAGIAAVTVGDFNNDGKLDLVVTSEEASSSAIGVLLGNGDGTFQTGGSYAAGFDAYGVTAADFNGDGNLDVAVADFDFSAGDISVLLGNGDGTFQPQVEYAVSAAPKEVITGDFNGDGKLDLAESGDNNQMSILLGNGDGTFKAQTTYATGNESLSLAAADFNLDGALDVATVNSGDSTFSVFLQDLVPVVSLAPASLTFKVEPVGIKSPAQTLTLTNTGNSTLVFSSTARASAGYGYTTNCGKSLMPGASCSFNVYFQPQTTGTVLGAFSLLDNAAGSPQRVRLTGTGTAAMLSTRSLNFGGVPVGQSSLPQSVTLTNVGSATFNIGAIKLTAGAIGAYAQTNTCPSSLAAGASCSVTVTFTPFKTGTLNATLQIIDDAGGGAQTVALTGTGTQ